MHAHEAAASQPLFSRTMQPAQRKTPVTMRRKRQRHASPGIELGPQARQGKTCCTKAVRLTNLGVHVRVAQAQAGPFHVIHRCVDVTTNEVFFHPEYTGPAGEEALHHVNWPASIEVASPTPMDTAKSSTEALTQHRQRSGDASIAPSEETATSGATKETGPAPSVLARRKRPALEPLQLDIIPAFKRRNVGQMCVLEAPATHVRLHAVPAGPHHVMHQCIDAHTEEMFFLPEYVGPTDAASQAAHRVQWPQVINAAPKLPEHQADEPLNYAVGEWREAQATVGPSSSDSAGEAAVPTRVSTASVSPATSPCCSTASDAGASTLSNGSTVARSAGFEGKGPEKTQRNGTPLNTRDAVCDRVEGLTEGRPDVHETPRMRRRGAPCPTVASRPRRVSEAAQGDAAAESGHLCEAGAVVTSTVTKGSPGTPCNVASATASLVARAVAN